MDPITVVATIAAKPGKEDAVESLLKNLILPTHQEEGCLRYALHRSLQDPARFVFVEQWENLTALQAHLGSAHVAAAMIKKDELLSSIDIATYGPMPAGDRAKGRL
jgi:quinol monooxygenase YgiN